MNEKWKQQAIENQNKVNNMLHSVEEEYERNPEKILDILKVGTAFYQYSLNNLKLIYAQRSDATYIQSFEAWKKMGVSVLRGEKGIKIFVPVRTTILTLPDGTTCSLSEATAEQKEQYHSGILKGQNKITYKIGNVFDISQTNFPLERRQEIAVEEDSLNSNLSLQNSANILIENTLNGNGSYKSNFENICTGIMLQIHMGTSIEEQTKEQLITCYHAFIRELEQLHPEKAKEEITKILEDSISVSIQEFREQISRNQKQIDATDMDKTFSIEEEVKKEGNVLSVSQANYRALMAIAPSVMKGEVEYAQFDAGDAFDKLSIEKIGPNMITMAHYFEQNGDLMADPDMEFEIDHEKQTLNARSFQNDVFAKYSCVIQEDGTVNTRLESELNSFAKTWLKNIKAQGYKLIVTNEKIEFFTLNLGGTGTGADTKPVLFENVSAALDAYLKADTDGKKLGVRIKGKDTIISEFDMVAYKNNYILDPDYFLNGTDESQGDELRADMQQIIEKLKYDNQVLSQEKIGETKQYVFEVIECSEYPSLGNTFSNIMSVEDALKQFYVVMENKANMVPGVNLIIKHGETKEQLKKIPLSSGCNIDLDMFNFYPELKEDKIAKGLIDEFVKKAKEAGFQTYGKYSVDESVTRELNHRRRHGR